MSTTSRVEPWTRARRPPGGVAPASLSRSSTASYQRDTVAREGGEGSTRRAESAPPVAIENIER
jgi:hypothetical protein